MRYQNWDVLLFPEGSKAPIQEFKTQCHVTLDLESPFLHSPTFTNVPFACDGPPVTQLPVLTSFVPSLSQSAPFRVSIHSWEKPRHSRLMGSLVGPHDAILFEARVYIDGVLVAESIFDQRNLWPLVLNTSAQLDSAGNAKPLRFPQFHQEILYQSHWEAGDLLGRIRIVIAEGFSRGIGAQGDFFDRVKDVVAFSFQHAPLHILKFSSIAWPNAGIWKRASGQVVHRSLSRGTKYLHSEDQHAHSPRRPTSGVSRVMLLPMTPTNNPTSACSGGNSGLRITSGLPLTEDPFTDPRKTGAIFRGSKRPTLEDTLMPTYISINTKMSQVYSNMTGLSFERKKDTNATTSINSDASLDELIHTLSPEKAPDILIEAYTPLKCADSGIQLPTDSPSSNVELSTWPSTVSQELSLEAAVNAFDRNIEREASTRSTPSSHDLPGPTEVSLPIAVIINASPTSSVRRKEKPAMALENLLQNRAASFGVVRLTSTGFKVAESSMDIPILAPSDTNRAGPGPNGSKRKRSAPRTPMPAAGEAEVRSPHKKASRKT